VRKTKCKHCGKEMVARNLCQIYCGRECKQAARNIFVRRNKLWRRWAHCKQAYREVPVDEALKTFTSVFNCSKWELGYYILAVKRENSRKELTPDEANLQA